MIIFSSVQAEFASMKGGHVDEFHVLTFLTKSDGAHILFLFTGVLQSIHSVDAGCRFSIPWKMSRVYLVVYHLSILGIGLFPGLPVLLEQIVLDRELVQKCLP